MTQTPFAAPPPGNAPPAGAVRRRARRVDHRSRVAAAFLLGGAGVVLAAWPPFENPLLALSAIAVGLALTVHGAGVRSLIGAYVGLIVLSFVVAPVLSGHDLRSMGPMWSLLAVWLLAWAAGQYLSDVLPRRRRRQSLATRTMDSVHVSATGVMIVGVISLVVQVLLIRSSEIGYTAQLRGFSSTGLPSIAASVGPVAIAAYYWLLRLTPGTSRRLRWVSAALVAAQSLAIAATGFRGGAPLYVLTVWIVGKRWATERPRKVLRSVAAVPIAMSIVALFFLGAQERARVAILAGRTSEGTELRAVTALPNQIIVRFDLQPPVQAALERASRPEARSVVSPRSQLVALVPRFLWPGKPEIDYGRRVSHEFFDIPSSYPTASSITWLGDLYVQGGTMIVLVIGLLLGCVVKRTLEWADPRNAIGLVVVLSVAQALLNLESPILITLATALRTILALLVIYAVVVNFFRIMARPLRHVPRRPSGPLARVGEIT